MADLTGMPKLSKQRLEGKSRACCMLVSYKQALALFPHQFYWLRKKMGLGGFALTIGVSMLTVKGKIPLLVIEELMDELEGASWFSKLDL
jgi:hypothetical protein